ncbi:MAG: LysR family transcriptional regulator [Clostridia bacterium]|nr:LysR family transcriptional regulator [Clostridia bacterium]
MAINFDYYRTFYYVAKYKKISLAAEKLYVSQPAITQTIQKLEEQLGSNLFVRAKSGMELTETGKMLYEFTSQSIEILDNVEYRFSKYENLEVGEIKIRTGSNVAKMILYDALEKFGKDYPNIKIEIATGAPNQSIEMLHSGEIDMVLVYLPYEVEYSNLQITECAKKEYIFAMSKEYQKENNVKIKEVSDLNKYSLIVPKKNSATRRIFDSKYKDIITSYHYEIAQEQMKKEFILRNMGIGFIIKDEIKEELEKGELVEIKLPSSKVEGAIGAITLNKKLSNFATNKLLEYMN